MKERAPLQNLLGLGIVMLILAILGWVAFGPGERHFTASSSFSRESPVSETSGRIAFGIGFVLLLVISLYGIRENLKKNGK
jgi:hypothetical protein